MIDDFSKPLFGNQGTVVTIGAYDGLHLGHRCVINQVIASATSEGLKSVLVTFDRHPASLVRPDSAPQLLTDHPQKIQLLGETGLDAIAVVPFDAAQASESPEDFVQRVLVNCLGAKKIIVGEDFHFGQGRRGNVTLLRQLGEIHGFEVEPLQLIKGDQLTVTSSSLIRSLIHDGDISQANELLGHVFELRGVVGHGDERGRTIGFPTANVEVSKSLCVPADGVYAAWYVRDLGNGQQVIMPAAVNIGRRPTFYENAEVSLIEAYVIDFESYVSGAEQLNLYGETAKLRFIARLRGEKKFAGLDDLKNQLVIDIDQCRHALIKP